jgi:RNA polymerase sigma-70 factor (ECF subfamily)
MDRSRSGGPVTAGIEQEIRDLYSLEAAVMLRHAVNVAGNCETAQDAVQEAFLRFFIARTAGQEIRNPKAWLFRVLRNHVLDQKKAGSRNEVSLESLANSPGPGRDPEAAYGRVEALSRTLKMALTPREIECVRLRSAGLRYEEIAGVLKMHSGTVGALLTRAHKKMRAAATTAADPGGGELTLRVATGKRYAS